MQGTSKNPFEVNDFSRGMTDNVYEQTPGTAFLLQNYLIGSDRKPKSRPGSAIDNATFGEIPNSSRIGALVNYANNDQLFYQSQRSIFYRTPGFLELIGAGGNRAFSVGSITNVPAFAQWNRHLYLTSDAFPVPQKIFKDGSGNYQLRSQGLPALPSSPTVTAGASGVNSYLYAFHFAVKYTVFQLQYQTIGPVTEVGLQNSAAPDASPNTISNIPVLTNAGGNNYDLANVQVLIFRTNADGTFFQQLGFVPNGTTTFVDGVSDIILQNTGAPLYINDGSVDYDPPPLHKFNHVVSNTGYFAHIIDESGNVSPYTIRQSVPGVPDTAPVDFTVNVDDEIVGISSVRSMPMVFCKKYVFRIDNFFDQFGRGEMDPIRVSDHAGCISHSSVVQAENGIFWFGNDGVYYSDGYIVNKVTDHLPKRYKSILANTAQTNRIIGKFYEKERLIIWTIQTNSSNRDNDTFLILDLKFGISSQMTFVTWTGNTFRPSALEVFNNQIYRGHPLGFTLVHDDSLFSDPKVDLYRSPSIWVNETIIWNLTSINYNFGGSMFRKMPTRILLTCADAGNTTIQIQAINDDGKIVRNCSVIRNRADFIWDDDDFVWDITNFVWRGGGLIEQWRRFPKRGLRLSTLQLVITNGFSDITNSDTLGTAAFASFSAVEKTATLDVVTNKWPDQAEDYYISTVADGYVQNFLILSRLSDSQVLISDPLNQIPVADAKWVIRGYKKDEPLYLLGYNIHWANVSTTQQTYDSSPASTGENA